MQRGNNSFTDPNLQNFDQRSSWSSNGGVANNENFANYHYQRSAAVGGASNVTPNQPPLTPRGQDLAMNPAQLTPEKKRKRAIGSSSRGGGSSAAAGGGGSLYTNGNNNAPSKKRVIQRQKGNRDGEGRELSLPSNNSSNAPSTTAATGLQFGAGSTDGAESYTTSASMAQRLDDMTLTSQSPTGRSATLLQPGASQRDASMASVAPTQLRMSQAQSDYSQMTADTSFTQLLRKKIMTDFQEVRELGKGSYGRVILARENATSDFFAIKVTQAHDATSSKKCQECVLLSRARELPHIITLFNAWVEGVSENLLYLQLQYCSGGSLGRVADERRKLAAAHGEEAGYWKEAEILHLLGQMAIALDSLHSLSIAHVDVKPDNILIDHNFNYFLSDFGNAVFFDASGRMIQQQGGGAGQQHQQQQFTSPNQLDRTQVRASSTKNPQQQNLENSGVAQAPNQLFNSTNSGSVFAAPMVGGGAGSTTTSSAPNSKRLTPAVAGGGGGQYEGQAQDEGDSRYCSLDMMNEKCFYPQGDIFSLGMTLYELMSGQEAPRGGDEHESLRVHGVNIEFLQQHRGYSAALVNLVNRMISRNPELRPTARQIVASELLRPNQLSISYAMSCQVEAERGGGNGGVGTNSNRSEFEIMNSFGAESSSSGGGALGGGGVGAGTDSSMQSSQGKLDPTTPYGQGVGIGGPAGAAGAGFQQHNQPHFPTNSNSQPSQHLDPMSVPTTPALSPPSTTSAALTCKLPLHEATVLNLFHSTCFECTMHILRVSSTSPAMGNERRRRAIGPVRDVPSVARGHGGHNHGGPNGKGGRAHLPSQSLGGGHSLTGSLNLPPASTSLANNPNFGAAPIGTPGGGATSFDGFFASGSERNSGKCLSFGGSAFHGSNYSRAATNNNLGGGRSTIGSIGTFHPASPDDLKTPVSGRPTIGFPDESPLLGRNTAEPQQDEQIPSAPLDAPQLHLLNNHHHQSFPQQGAVGAEGDDVVNQ